MPIISGNIQRKTLDISSMSDLGLLVKSIALAYTLPTNCEMTRVDLRLGNDYYLDIVLSQKNGGVTRYLLAEFKTRMDLSWERDI